MTYAQHTQERALGQINETADVVQSGAADTKARAQNSAHASTERVKQEAGDAASRVNAHASDMGERVKAQTGDTVERVKGPAIDAAKRAEELHYKASQVILQGKDWSSHPIHPSTVHFPIAFLTTAFGLDTIQLFGLGDKLPSFMPPALALNGLAHYAGAAGILSALPAIATGLGELYDMYRGQAMQKGLAQAQSDAIKSADAPGRKLKTTMIHAFANDAVVALATFNWWTRRQDDGFALPTSNSILSAIALPALLYSAYLGGSLVYHHGVAVQRQGGAEKLKSA